MQRINALLRTVASWVSAVLRPWPSRAPPTREGCMSPWGSGCPCRCSSPRRRPSMSHPASPVYVYPAPVVVEHPPVVVQPPVVYGQPYSRGYASYGGYGRPWRHRHHDDGDHAAHGHYWRPNGGHGWRR